MGFVWFFETINISSSRNLCRDKMHCFESCKMKAFVCKFYLVAITVKIFPGLCGSGGKTLAGISRLQDLSDNYSVKVDLTCITK